VDLIAEGKVKVRDTGLFNAQLISSPAQRVWEEIFWQKTSLR